MKRLLTIFTFLARRGARAARNRIPAEIGANGCRIAWGRSLREQPRTFVTRSACSRLRPQKSDYQFVNSAWMPVRIQLLRIEDQLLVVVLNSSCREAAPVGTTW